MIWSSNSVVDPAVTDRWCMCLWRNWRIMKPLILQGEGCQLGAAAVLWLAYRGWEQKKDRDQRLKWSRKRWRMWEGSNDWIKAVGGWERGLLKTRDNVWMNGEWVLDEEDKEYVWSEWSSQNFKAVAVVTYCDISATTPTNFNTISARFTLIWTFVRLWCPAWLQKLFSSKKSFQFVSSS